MNDSAIVAYETFASRRKAFSYDNAALLLPITLRRLGELYEVKGDVTSALKYYQEFVKLWANVDPELQPQVTEIRERLQGLIAAEARKR